MNIKPLDQKSSFLTTLSYFASGTLVDTQLIDNNNVIIFFKYQSELCTQTIAMDFQTVQPGNDGDLSKPNNTKQGIISLYYCNTIILLTNMHTYIH